MRGIRDFGLIGVFSPDPVLSIMGAIGLASAAPVGLVIDLCGDMNIRSDYVLSDLLGFDADRPVAAHRSGVALVRGGTGVEEAQPLLHRLAERWPAVIARLPGPLVGQPAVPVRALLPGFGYPDTATPSVWQPVFAMVKPPGPGPVLPMMRRRMVVRALRGERIGGRWVEAWRKVWSMPWD